MIERDYQVVIGKIAQDVFRQPSISYEAAQLFRDIPGFDSILAIQYILAIETALDVSLNEEEVDNMHTMGDLLSLVLAKKA